MIVTDAWSPQINGVVITLRNTIRELPRQGHDVATSYARRFPHDSVSDLPGDPAVAVPRCTRARRIEEFAPDALHIATEGPLGFAARGYGLRTRRPFTTAYHTQFPEYVHARSGLPVGMTYRWMRWFHAPARS